MSFIRLNGLTICTLLAVLISGQANAGEPENLAALSLEELMRLEVRSVSRRDQQLARTPAAVYVITQEDIRRSGASSIPEVLRGTPGLQVARISSNQWAVSARGFNSRISNKMLVLIDGRSVYNNLYSGVFWDQNDVLLEDVQRIEVIRGPGATMWGANAVNGVINVITKKAQDTQGTLVTAGTGVGDRASGAVRYGGSHGDNVYYRGYSKYFNRGDMRSPEGASARDDWQALRGGGRLDWQLNKRDSVTLHGEVYGGLAHQYVNPTAPYETGSSAWDPISFSGGYGLGRWERQMEGSDFAVQAYYNREARAEGIGSGTLHTVDFDFQHHIEAGERHNLMWGAGYRLAQDHMDRNHTPFAKNLYRDNLLSMFVQDDFSIVPDRLVLTLGSKFQHNSYTGMEVQPGVRALWTPTAQQSFWASASRAVRSPSIQDLDLHLDLEFPPQDGMRTITQWRGNPSLPSEVVLAYEVGYRRQLTRRVSLDIATFRNRYTNLQSAEMLTPMVNMVGEPILILPFTYNNPLRGTTYGIETTASWTPAKSWRLEASHTWLKGSMAYHNLIGTPFQAYDSLHAPRNTVDLRSEWDIHRGWSLDTRLYCVSRLTQPDVPAYVRGDARIAYRLSESAEISAGVDNLLDNKHIEFIPLDYAGNSVIRRSAFVKMIWSF